jgi:hypothetical protein
MTKARLDKVKVVNMFENRNKFKLLILCEKIVLISEREVWRSSYAV